MKKGWILRLIVICSIMLLGERLSSSAHLQPSSRTSLHATTDHSDAMVAIELEDELEDEAISFIHLISTFEWKPKLLLLIPFFALIFQAQHVLTKTPPYIRFHNLRL